MSQCALILGYGLTGQGIARFLAKQNITYVVYAPSHASHEHTFVDDAYIDAHIASLSIAYVSPGFKPTHPCIQKLLAHNIPLATDMDLLEAYSSVPKIAVTGTNGKSTVCSWLGKLLSQQGMHWAVVGNIGVSVLDAMDQAEGLVIELSSFQLYYTTHLTITCGVMLPIAPDHWDWHGDQESYYQAKCSMLSYGKAIVSDTLPELKTPDTLSYGSTGDVYWRDTCIYFPDGRRTAFDPTYYWRSVDKDNLTAVAAVLYTRGIVMDSMPRLPFLPYRNDITCHPSGWIFMNNSKATNMHATFAMVQDVFKAYPDMPMLLMMGGVFKEDFIVPALRQGDKVFVFGSACALLQEHSKHMETFLTLDDALTRIRSMLSMSPHCVVFAPGGASFDAFKDYTERGAYFAQWVAAL